jgi:outer membrane protein assembly factor BamE (lipoprotein component of BamABCDE complex)
MRRTGRKLLIVVALLVALCCLELGREELVYLYVSSNLEHGYWRVRPNMTRGQVREILGQPDAVLIEEGTLENWRWDARLHQGWLWRATGLASLKKHYQLTVSFNGQQTVTDVFGESR